MLEKLSTDGGNTLDPRSLEGLTASFEDVRARLTAAAGGREITLLAATKTVPADCINYAIDRLGLADVGENRVQELLEKYDALHKEHLNIHFIGRLQTNKVKYIADKVCMIHSLDSDGLAAEIEKQCAKQGRVMDVLIEINLAGEAAKGGLAADAAPDFIRGLARFPRLRPRGIMVIPPAGLDRAENRAYFNRAKALFDRLAGEGLFASDAPLVLSMGMSDSFEEAAACGSTLVRIGSALFGRRTAAVPENENK